MEAGIHGNDTGGKPVMLQEETELWIESVWETMSEQLRKKVVVAVDTGLMNAQEPDVLPESVIKAVTGNLLDEARTYSGDGGALEEIPLGKHDIRSVEGEGFGNFKVGDALSSYVLVRVLL
jgi:hypothetical protein